jgi:hypothetical protein
VSARSRLRGCLAALIALAGGALGANDCAPPSGASGSPPPAASLNLVPMTPYWLSGGAWYAVARVQVNAAEPLQAYDLELTWTPDSASNVYLLAHPAFSDDGNYLAQVAPAELAEGRIAHLLDLRHGPGTALGGTLDLAYVVLRVSTPAPVWVQVAGELARPDGTQFATTPSARLRLLPPAM